jgi:hypothetical protein
MRAGRGLRQTGFGLIDFVIYAACIVAMVGAIAMLVHSVATFIENTHREGYDQGVAATEAAATARTNARLAALNARILALAKERDALEQKLRLANDKFAAQAAKEKERADTQAAGTLADLDSGALVLRDGVVELVSGCPAGRAGDAQGAPGAGAGGDPCKPRYRLSKETEGRLVGIAKDGQLSAGNLAACLGIADSDRALINGAAP